MPLPAGLQYPGSREPITLSKVLVVEGGDAFYFFKALLKELDLSSTIETRNAGSVTELPKYIKVLSVTPGFANVTSLGIIRDAEKNAKSAFQSVCTALKKTKLPVPKKPLSKTGSRPSVSIHILPDNKTPGMLETICLQSVNDDPVIECINHYFECVNEKTGSLPKNMPKAQVQAFLASKQKPGLRLGEAANKGYWPWDSQEFENIKNFLLAL